MSRILVPVDFTNASINSAEYAIQWAATMHGASVLLFSVYVPGGIGDDGTPITDEADNRKNQIHGWLENLQVKLFEKASVPTDIAMAKGEFEPELLKLLAAETFDLVVMGVAAASDIEEKLLGTSAVDLSSKINVPLLVVGANMQFETVSKIAVGIDLSSSVEQIPMAQLKGYLAKVKSELHFIYATDESNGDLSEAQQQEQHRLLQMFEEFNPQFAHVHLHSFTESINQYVLQTHINQLVVMPRKHSLWHKLVGVNHTKLAVFHSKVPVLAIHE
jgi:nucleotide-binding universal stress UspA family protein